MGAYYDKYDPKSGGFRAPLDADQSKTSGGNPLGVGLDSSGNVVVGAGNTGVIGILVTTRDMKAGDIVDVMTDGECVGLGSLAAGTPMFAHATTGVISATPSLYPVGYTAEATRLVVRLQKAGAATDVVGDQPAIVHLTDNSGGTADDTIAEITEAANAGSADVGPTANAIADLAAKQEEILSALESAGLLTP